MSSALERAASQQMAAADPAASVFVTANAGSGKTKVLIDRVARLLLAGGTPSSFLCITYTKAAAAEMQRRLFARLGAWCVAGDAVLRSELAALGESDSASPQALARARALFARALETPGGLRIQTIHAFCERLIGRFPLEAGVAPGFEIADEAMVRRLVRQAWGQAAHRPAIDAALQRLGSRISAFGFQEILEALAAKRSKLGAPGQAGSAAIAARHGTPPSADALHAEGLARAPWQMLTDAQGALLAGSPKDQEAAQRIAAARAAPDSFELYQAIFLKKTDGEPHIASPTRGTRNRLPWLGALFDAESARMVEFASALRARAKMEDSQAMHVLGHEIAGAYAEAKRRAGVLDFDDLIESALGLLGDGPAAAWVLYKLDGGIDHILVDEGQDTSPSQWALLAPFQAEFFAGEGARGAMRRTVFAVGDPKQSIYSFQGADPAGFLAQAQALSAQAHAAQRPFVAPSLGMSFRSCPQVLAVVDAVFADQALDRPSDDNRSIREGRRDEPLPIEPGSGLGGDIPGVFDRVSHTAWRENQMGLVQLWPPALRPQLSTPSAWEAPLDQEQADASPALLAKAIAENVRAWIDARDGVWEDGALRPMHAGDVLVLVKKRGEVFHAVLRALKRAGLPVAGADRVTLPEELAVQDMLACMRLAVDGADDLALACVLKGPFVGLTDDDRDLFALAHGRAKGERLLDRLRALSAEPRWCEAAAFVEALLTLGGANPFDFLSGLLEGTDARGQSGWQRMMARLGEEARDPLEELLAKAMRAPALGQGNLWAFLGAMSADGGTIKREGEESGRAVRVMTVHGAKGLEAPVVFLADTAAQADAGPSESLFWDEAGPLLASAAKMDDAATARSRQAQAQAQAAEHLRLLYVAMTRAQDRLIICGAAQGRDEGKVAETGWHALVDRVMQRIGEPIETPFGGGFQLGERLVAPQQAGEIATAPTPAPDWLLRLAHFQQKCSRGFVSENAQIQTDRASDPTKSDSDLVDDALVEQALPARPRPARPLPGRLGLAMPGNGPQRFARGRLIHGLLQRLPDVAPERRRVAGERWLARQGSAPDAARVLLDEALAVLAHEDCAPAFWPGSRAEQPVIGAGVRGIVDRMLITPSEVWVVEFKTDRPAPRALAQVDRQYLAQLDAYQRVLQLAFPARRIRAALIWTEEPRVMPVPELPVPELPVP